MTPPLADAFIITLCNERLAPSVAEQPAVVLIDWRVVSRVNGDELLVGFWNSGISCRVTTPIAHFDPQRREVRTASGRQYELSGPPASSVRALLLIAARLVANGLSDCSDATAVFWQQIAAATQ
jgi:hypothetical protein